MKFIFALLLIFSVMMSSRAIPLTSCAGGDARSAAQRFFAAHARFYAENPARIRELVTPRFFAALERENKCAEGAVCAIEAVPWTDAQDGNMEKPITFQVKNLTAEHATVEMRYVFALSRRQKQSQRVLLLMERHAADRCWLVADLVGPRGKSFIAHLEAWHREFDHGH